MEPTSWGARSHSTPDFFTTVLSACSPIEEAIRFPSTELTNIISTSLSIPNGRLPTVRDVRIERSFRTTDGLQGCILSYPSLGNQRIEACLLKPEGVTQPLPGVLALHCHGNIKRWGWRKIADDDRGTIAELSLYRERGYAGRAYPNELAKQGFVVLVPDCFMWGSRALASSDKPHYYREAGELLAVHQRFASKIPPEYMGSDLSQEMATDNYFEPEVEKALGIAGASIASVVNFDDRTSAQVLSSLVDVDQRLPLTAIGLSGGGNRVGMLMAMEPSVRIGVIAGMMCTYRNLISTRNFWKHTHMLYPPNREGCRYGEWPDLVASQAHSKSLYCLYNESDPLFTLTGQQEAHERLRAIHRAVNREAHYQGRFFSGGHKFDREMQDWAFRSVADSLQQLSGGATQRKVVG